VLDRRKGNGGGVKDIVRRVVQARVDFLKTKIKAEQQYQQELEASYHDMGNSIQEDVREREALSKELKCSPPSEES
jgi:hypothetical protein